MSGRAAVRALPALLAVLAASRAAADSPDPPDPPAPVRLEWAAFPALAGSTDIGFQFGLMVFLAKFDPAYQPFRWRVEAQAATSVKPGPGGVDFPVHNDYVKADLPGLAGGRLRLYLEGAWRRAVTAGYWGIGNDAHPRPASTDPAAGPVVPRARRPYGYVIGEPMFRGAARVAVGHGLHVLTGLKLSWQMPDAWPGSRLDLDARHVSGLQDHLQVDLQAGLLYDTRDHEAAPTRGWWVEVSARAAPGLGNDLHFGGVHVHARTYVPLLGDRLVLAVRAMADLLFGNVPFYEMARAGAFQPIDAPGGQDAVRGIPQGRYHGKVKVVGSVELRSFFWRFSLFGERLRLGAAAFADAGRVWAGYREDPRDGEGVGLRYGVGGGLRLQWGETVLIRGDVAWSPDAADGDLPVGLYFDAGMAF